MDLLYFIIKCVILPDVKFKISQFVVYLRKNMAILPIIHNFTYNWVFFTLLGYFLSYNFKFSQRLVEHKYQHW